MTAGDIAVDDCARAAVKVDAATYVDRGARMHVAAIEHDVLRHHGVRSLGLRSVAESHEPSELSDGGCRGDVEADEPPAGRASRGAPHLHPPLRGHPASQ